MVLIFCLAYHDTLEETTNKQKIFYFFYVAGKPGAYSLVSDDYGKIYPRLLDYLISENDSICPIEDVKETKELSKLFPDIFRKREKTNTSHLQSKDFSRWLIEGSKFNFLLLKTE